MYIYYRIIYRIIYIYILKDHWPSWISPPLWLLRDPGAHNRGVIRGPCAFDADQNALVHRSPGGRGLMGWMAVADLPKKVDLGYLDVLSMLWPATQGMCILCIYIYVCIYILYNYTDTIFISSKESISRREWVCTQKNTTRTRWLTIIWPIELPFWSILSIIDLACLAWPPYAVCAPFGRWCTAICTFLPRDNSKISLRALSL